MLGSSSCFQFPVNADGVIAQVTQFLPLSGGTWIVCAAPSFGPGVNPSPQQTGAKEV